MSLTITHCWKCDLCGEESAHPWASGINFHELQK